MLREGTVVNGGSTACHGLNLVLDLNQKGVKVFSLSGFILESLLMSFFILFNCSISINFPCLWKAWFQLLECLHASIALEFFYIVSVVVRFYHGTIVRTGVTCSDISSYMRNSVCRWLIAENAKIFRSKTFFKVKEIAES